MSDPTWPKGFGDFYYKVRLNADKIRNGVVLSLDPSSGGSSMPGFAIYLRGVLQTQGMIQIPKKMAIDQRLQVLLDKVSTLLPEPPDVLAIELIRGRMAHVFLQWSIGCSIAAAHAGVTIEVPIRVWRSVAAITPNYIKSDASDAVMIGQSVILLAQEK